MSDSKEHILNVAFELFLQKSFKEVTMKEIVGKTGLSKGAFYHYFTSKEQLFLEIIDIHYASFFSIDYSQFNQDSLYHFYHDYLDYLDKAFSEFASRLGGKAKLKSVNYYLLIFDAIKLLPDFRQRAGEMAKKEKKSWESIVKNARNNGEINSSMTDEQIAKIFIATNDGIGIHLITFGNIDLMKQEILDLWDSFYQQIKV